MPPFWTNSPWPGQHHEHEYWQYFHVHSRFSSNPAIYKFTNNIQTIEQIQNTLTLKPAGKFPTNIVLDSFS